MQRRAAVVLFLLIFTTGAFAKEVFLPVSGTANNVFFSDARIFNPNDREITVQAYYLPRGNNSNAGEQPISFTVPKRQMKISDDIVKNLLLRADVGGIRFVSPDDFVVTQRVYALSTVNCGTGPLNPCTLGQFVQGLDLSAAVKKGVILQLKAGEKFRTNVGALNPNAVPATVTWRLYDKDNKLVSTGAPIVMPPYATIGPTSITTTFFFNPGSVDAITDAWVSFDSDQPIFAYGSVVDNGSSDQTYIPASADSGVTPPVEPPQTKVISVTVAGGRFSVSVPEGLRQGDQVRVIASSGEGLHGIRLFAPDSSTVLNIDPMGTTPVERLITLAASGRYQYICTRPVCGTHDIMNGEFTVSAAGTSTPPH